MSITIVSSAALGAGVGSILCPGVGTAVGACVGSLVGGAAIVGEDAHKSMQGAGNLTHDIVKQGAAISLGGLKQVFSKLEEGIEGVTKTISTWNRCAMALATNYASLWLSSESNQICENTPSACIWAKPSSLAMHLVSTISTVVLTARVCHVFINKEKDKQEELTQSSAFLTSEKVILNPVN